MKQSIFCTILISIFLFTALPVTALAGDEGTGQKAVLVTGASTGLGRKIAEDLAGMGFHVYAGARKQKDLDALDAIENIQAVRLDVTIQEEIDAAVTTVEKGGKGLYGLVNNAGVFTGGPLIEVDVEDYEWIMDVNVTGVYRVTQAFAPMIIESQGRITTISSISGINSGRFFGHYTMSKHAVEAYTDSLAVEMQKFGVAVSAIEPGNYNSAIGATAMKNMASSLSVEDSRFYKDELTEWVGGSWDREKYKEPDEVSEAAQHFFTNDKPLRRYMVVPSEPEAAWAIDKAIEEVVQYNQWQAYSYTREQLIEKLDAALEKAGK